MKTVTFSEAKNNLNNILNRVVEDTDYTIIKRQDAEDVVVMSLDTFNGYLETIHLMSSPANARHLAKSVTQYQQGLVQENNLIHE